MTTEKVNENIHGFFQNGKIIIWDIQASKQQDQIIMQHILYQKKVHTKTVEHIAVNRLPLQSNI